MKISAPSLLTPVFLKTTPEMTWPEEEPVFHLLTGSGLFLCRNHPFFRSSVPVTRWPSELTSHQPFASFDFPKIPQRLFEQIVGFFSVVGDRFSAEAAVLLAWNKKTSAVELIVPDQCAVVGTNYRGDNYPLTVEYDVPSLCPDVMLFGDVHSHVDGFAYSSAMDVQDEVHRPGLHIVVGRINREPPDLHVELTVDGTRFNVRNVEEVIEGYEKRRCEEVPAEWLQRHTVKSQKPHFYSAPKVPYSSGSSYSTGTSYSSGSSYADDY